MESTLADAAEVDAAEHRIARTVEPRRVATRWAVTDPAVAREERQTEAMDVSSCGYRKLVALAFAFFDDLFATDLFGPFPAFIKGSSALVGATIAARPDVKRLEAARSNRSRVIDTTASGSGLPEPRLRR
jgi:hypothetical protein